VTQTNVLNGTLEVTSLLSTNVICSATSIQITQAAPFLSGNQISIGPAPVTNQGLKSIAIGSGAGSENQNTWSIAIGYEAGYENQGKNSIAIGSGAGRSGQHDNTIILYANAMIDGVVPPLNSKQPESFYVSPIRQSSDASTFLSYTANSEVIQSNVMTFDGTSNIITTSTNFVTQNLVTHGSLSRTGFSSANTVSPTDTWIIVGNETGSMTLPDPTLCLGREIGIRKRSGGDYYVYSVSSNVLDLTGSTTNVIIRNNRSLAYLVSDGTQWVVMIVV
jgi:hypothetical protein